MPSARTVLNDRDEHGGPYRSQGETVHSTHRGMGRWLCIRMTAQRLAATKAVVVAGKARLAHRPLRPAPVNNRRKQEVRHRRVDTASRVYPTCGAQYCATRASPSCGAIHRRRKTSCAEVMEPRVEPGVTRVRLCPRPPVLDAQRSPPTHTRK